MRILIDRNTGFWVPNINEFFVNSRCVNKGFLHVFIKTLGRLEMWLVRWFLLKQLATTTRSPGEGTPYDGLYE